MGTVDKIPRRYKIVDSGLSTEEGQNKAQISQSITGSIQENEICEDFVKNL